MPDYGQEVVIIGKRSFLEALDNLPGRVIQKIMDAWTLKQAQNMAKIARMTAPRDRKSPRMKPESARLWRSIRATKVRKLAKFPQTVSRSIAYSAIPPGSRGFRAVKGKKLTRKGARAPKMGPMTPRARHFHLAVLGTKARVQKTTRRYTGSMWGKSPNPQFWTKSQNMAMAVANGEVGAQLRDAYERGIELELRRLKRKYI